MRRIFDSSETERSVQEAYPGISVDPERRLVLMIALQAYLDIVLYKEHLLETASKTQGHRHTPPELERQYRYSLVFFLHPWMLSGQTYAGHLFSVAGMDSILRRIQSVVRRLEAEIGALEKSASSLCEQGATTQSRGTPG